MLEKRPRKVRNVRNLFIFIRPVATKTYLCIKNQSTNEKH